MPPIIGTGHHGKKTKTTLAHMQKKRAFTWTYPSDVQKDILGWWGDYSPYKDMPYFQSEGSIRCGKTVLGTFSYIHWASVRYDGEEFALSSKTIGTCLRNVVRPVLKVFSEEPRFSYDYKRSQKEGSHIVVTDNELDHENTFWIYGGKDEASQDLLQGKTLAGILFDEPTLMPMSFINQGLARLSVENSKAWFFNNPETPTHKLYVDVLDPYREEGKLYYVHITMHDNPSLSLEAINRISSQWPIGSVLYTRYVLGLRVAAEGRVYSFFRVEPEHGYVVEEVPKGGYSMYLVGMDYGISNPFAAGLWGLHQGVWYMLKEYYWDSVKEKEQLMNSDYVTALSELCKMPDSDGVIRVVMPTKILVPPEEPEFQAELTHSSYPHLKRVADADNSISPGIEDLTTLLGSGRLKLLNTCKNSIWGIDNLIWDAKKQAQGVDMYVKGGSGAPDHAADMMRYIAREAKRILVRMRLMQDKEDGS